MAVLKTTYEHYINNPSIVGTSILPFKLVLANYAARFDKVLVREGGELQYKQYVDSKGNRFIHVKVPSEVVPKFYYDVVIEFMDQTMLTVLPSLEKYNVKFFSNDPAFIFTYAYAFNKSGLLIDELKDKLPKECLENKAVVRNPNSNIGAVKSFYFCYLFLKLRGLFSKLKWSKQAPLNPGTFAHTIQNGETKIADRQRLGAQHKDNKPGKSLIKKSTPNKKKYESNSMRFVNKAKPVKKVRTAKRVKIVQPKVRNKHVKK